MTGAERIAARLPFFYGWVVVGCAVCASFARQGAAVATLSMFIVPMTVDFGWSRTEISGAVSLGGLAGALVSPALGTMVDRRGARLVLTLSAVVLAASALALAGTSGLVWFYLAFGVARLVFAGPFEIGITAAVANWFVRGRARAMSVISISIGLSLVVMPLMAALVIDIAGWRQGWVAVAVAVLLVGAAPSAWLMLRRPEDVGLVPDGGRAPGPGGDGDAAAPSPAPEPVFTRREAMRTPALWLLMAYTGLLFPVQAGMSLHQAPHMVDQGMSPGMAALMVGTFSAAVAGSSLGYAWLAARWPVRRVLALAAFVAAAGMAAMREIEGAVDGFMSSALFGVGIGGVLTLGPVILADYYGRRHFGAIRGVVVAVQVVGQAIGPLIAGFLYDIDGSYRGAVSVFGVLALLAGVAVLLARPPRWPPVEPAEDRRRLP